MPPQTGRCPNCFGATAVTPCSHCGWQVGQDNPPPALALGRVLDGRYRVGRVLGHGGFGITYLAWDDNLHLRLAIKEYFPRDSAGRGADGVSLAIYSGQAGDQFAYGLERFLEEARTLAHFDQHPGIVTVKNFFRAHGTGYCVMDYVEGITLRQYLDQQPGGRISVADALQLLTPVMDALRAVHKDGLLHRDLAPDNIYLTQDGRIKLLDFGAARFAASEHSKSLSIILKPGYAPEEQYRTKGRQGPWTDVYGLAATLYRAITGQVPPEALDRLDIDDLVPPSRLGVAIKPEQEATLLRALAVKARDRFQSMAELQQAWRTAAMPLSDPPTDAGVAEPARAPVTPATGAPRKGKSLFVIAIAGIVALLAVGGAVLWLETSAPPTPKVTAHQAKPAQTEPASPVPIMAAPPEVVTLAPAAPATPTPPMTTVVPTVPAAPIAQPAPDSATSPAMAEQASAPAVDAAPSTGPPPALGVPNEPLGTRLKREVGGGGPVAILAGTRGLFAVSSDGKRNQMLWPQPTAWVLVDARGRQIWFGAADKGSTDVLTLDLDAVAPQPVVVATGIPNDKRVAIVYRQGKKEESLHFKSGIYDG